MMRIMQTRKQRRRDARMRRGQLSIQVIIFAVVAMIFISGFVLWAASFLQSTVRNFNKLLAFSVAEAGIEYYRWHLAHAPLDFEDGTGGPGPYVHNYYDKDGTPLGAFSLEITPPSVGSTLVTIESTGTVLADPTVEKTIRVRLGIPSFAIYALIGNENLRIASGTTAFGRVHSNGGVRFDGKAWNVVTSARTEYDDPTHSGGEEFGVHTHQSPTDPLPPNPLPPRPDVFVAGRTFPVPAVDFDSVTGDLAAIKTTAQTSGYYRAASGALGYHAVLKTDDTFDLYRIDKLLKKPPGCTPIQSQDDWDTWTIDTETLLEAVPFPANGLVFLEDEAWVDGQIDTARLTIAVGSFPETAETSKSITVNKNLRYTNVNGDDVIGLLAQKNVNIGLVSENNLRIDAALVAKSGRFGRFHYRPEGSQGQGGCQPYHTRELLETFGMVATNKDLQVNYEDNTGYLTWIFRYDANLLYRPPPFFPLVGTGYEQISWEEVK